VVDFHFLTIHQDGSFLDSVLDSIAAGLRQLLREELIDTDRLLAGVDGDGLGFDVVDWGHRAKIARALRL
jgi:hypothetical protein